MVRKTLQQRCLEPPLSAQAGEPLGLLSRSAPPHMSWFSSQGLEGGGYQGTPEPHQTQVPLPLGAPEGGSLDKALQDAVGFRDQYRSNAYL